MNRIFDLCLLFLLFAVSGIGFYILIDSQAVLSGAREYAKLKSFLPEEITEDSLKMISADAVAWLELDGTQISYPILQAEDNSTYLDRDPEGNYSVSGSIFLDFRNAPDFSDRYSIVYGHHMANRMMFGSLDDFSDPEFFMQHRSGRLRLPERELSFRTVAWLVVPAGCEEIFEPGTETDHAAYFSVMAEIYVPEDMTARLAALTTCAGDDRFREVLVLALEE